MMVLVALESLQIRALHSQSAQSVSLRAAVLEGADNLPSGSHANNVEICLCPGNYLGDSCQVVCFNDFITSALSLNSSLSLEVLCEQDHSKCQ